MFFYLELTSCRDRLGNFFLKVNKSHATKICVLRAHFIEHDRDIEDGHDDEVEAERFLVDGG